MSVTVRSHLDSGWFLPASPLGHATTRLVHCTKRSNLRLLLSRRQGMLTCCIVHCLCSERVGAAVRGLLSMQGPANTWWACNVPHACRPGV